MCHDPQPDPRHEASIRLSMTFPSYHVRKPGLSTGHLRNIESKYAATDGLT